MKFEFYKESLDFKTEGEIFDNFIETLVDTNRGYNFFVDWEKIKKNIEKFKNELNILNYLVRSKNFDDEFKNIVLKNPCVIKVFPLLIAVRDLKINVVEDFSNPHINIVEYDFSNTNISEQNVEKLLFFVKKSGLKDFFLNIIDKSIFDYLYGIEVGLDTHARKNRSGNAMELAVKPIFEELSKKYIVLFQKSFACLKKYNIEVSDSIANRKADFIILKRNKKINTDIVIDIEVNFYSGTGSKPQEIVDSYINRQYELYKNGFKFIWLTDGKAWGQQLNQLQKAFDNVDFILNLNWIRKGLLEKIINFI